MTLLVYAALGAVLFFLVLQLQTVGGYGALQAGVATLPITVCMLLLASRGGALAARIGPRIPDDRGSAGDGGRHPVAPGVGADVDYWTDVLPGLTVFGLGLALMVAPLTATVLAAASDEHAGIASGVNNAVARAGSFLAVAALPVAVGLGGDEYADPLAFDAAYETAVVACAVLLALGGVLSWLTIRGPGDQRSGGGGLTGPPGSPASARTDGGTRRSTAAGAATGGSTTVRSGTTPLHTSGSAPASSGVAGGPSPTLSSQPSSRIGSAMARVLASSLRVDRRTSDVRPGSRVSLKRSSAASRSSSGRGLSRPRMVADR